MSLYGRNWEFRQLTQLATRELGLLTLCVIDMHMAKMVTLQIYD